MRISYLIAGVIGAAIAIMVGGGLKIWFQGEETTVTMAAPAPEESAAPAPSQATQPARPVIVPNRLMPEAAPRPDLAKTNKPAIESEPAPPPAEELPAEGAAVDWPAKVQQLLDSDLPENMVARQLIGLLGQAPPENQVHIAEVMVRIMPDQDYPAVIPLLINPATTPEVLDVMMVDLLDRPATVQLPLFLDIARNEQHPRHAEALDYLQLFTGQNLGNDWSAWEEGIKKVLQENPQ